MLLQRIPGKTIEIQPTTCGVRQCPQKENVFVHNDFRLSSESSNHFDSEKNTLGYKAAYPLVEVLESLTHPECSKRGIGKRGERWRCLRCMEALCQKLDGWLQLQHKKRAPLIGHPFAEFAEFIFADERVLPKQSNHFTVHLIFKVALEKWKAVNRWTQYNCNPDTYKVQAPPHVKVPKKLIPGVDGQSLYLDRGTRNLRGISDNGDLIELRARDCIDNPLLECLQKVGRMMDAAAQARKTTQLGLPPSLKRGLQTQTFPQQPFKKLKYKPKKPPPRRNRAKVSEAVATTDSSPTTAWDTGDTLIPT